MNADAAYIIATSRQRELIHEAAEHRRSRLARHSRDHDHGHVRVSMAAVAAVLLALTAVAI